MFEIHLFLFSLIFSFQFKLTLTSKLFIIVCYKLSVLTLCVLSNHNDSVSYMIMLLLVPDCWYNFILLSFIICSSWVYKCFAFVYRRIKYKYQKITINIIKMQCHTNRFIKYCLLKTWRTLHCKKHTIVKQKSIQPYCVSGDNAKGIKNCCLFIYNDGRQPVIHLKSWFV